MGNVSVRKETGKLYFDFRYKGKRCREQTLLENTPDNLRKMQGMLKRIDAEITLGTFEYARYFPTSPHVSRFQPKDETVVLPSVNVPDDNDETPTVEVFSKEWLEENQIRWKRSYSYMVSSTLNSHVLPAFGGKKVSNITKGEVLKFRSTLAKVSNGKKEGLSPDRINHIMTPLRMILADAADRYNFITPFIGIKPLRVPRTEVDPFSLDEVRQLLVKVRVDFRNYYTVRFFTGMRTSEIDGLKWINVDFERKLSPAT
jgi:integrase